ncbi:hypothetical protein FT663_04708 [Candidozyma haemuli var. vulneris]|nr:hypothetical protein FT663_04708 [[Candida] haemuloni var. vulneris]KAF3990679.1 hypothetical protein FT662_02102 [[Candida] haemuloni var. vulneris]
MSFPRASIAILRPTVRLHFIRFNSKKTDPRPRWFFCSDAPLTKPAWFEYKQEKEPTKFLPFSEVDEKNLEKAYSRNEKTVEVKEDRLFEVDLKTMVLSPVYWEGPTYEVRRGIWFDHDGTPLSSHLAKSIEDSYCLRRPYEHVKPDDSVAPTQKQSKDIIARFNKEIKELHKDIEKETIDFSEERDIVDLGDGNAVIYFDGNQAAMFPSEINPVQLGILRKLGPKSGTLLGVTPIQRGYSEDLNATIMDSIKNAPVPSLTDIFSSELSSLFSPQKQHEKVLTNNAKEADKDEMLQTVMESDFQELKVNKSNDRDVDHLVLCVHGIGQILGYKYESVNFTHSINVMRSTMREVFQNDEKYKKLAYGDSYDSKNEEHSSNNRIQTLPITWRHKVNFHPRKRIDDLGNTGDERLPSLSDINVDGVRPLRNIVGDVILDVLLYYEPKFMNQILKIVSEELNRVYKLYMERHPEFDGKVHILGHSLGSAIAFDILAMQTDDNHDLKLDFDVENLFCIGSPVGAFKLLQRRNIKSRSNVSEGYDPSKPDLKFVSPKCQNLYNIFHPCDPVGYRMEPLIKPSFSKMKPEEVPFALKGFNTQVKSLTSFGDEVQQKIFSNWFGSKKDGKNIKMVETKASEENALGDIITTLASPLSSGQSEDPSEEVKDSYLSDADINVLTELNRSGRVDYSLPTGVFSIALISAISAHVSYFEDQDTAGFVMKEILCSSQDSVESKKVKVYK